MAQVRAAALSNYIETARSVGLDPYRMLRRAGISPLLLADPEQRLPGGSAIALLNESAREASCPGFGLLMAESRALAGLGAVGLLARHQQDLREVIVATARYQSFLSELLDIRLDESDPAMLRMDAEDGAAPDLRQARDMILGIFHRALSTIFAHRWRPISVHFTHSEPLDSSVHRRMFDCELVFDGGFNGFLVPRAMLDEPNPMADASLAHHAREFLDKLVAARPGRSIVEQARTALRLLLPRGLGTLEQLAAQLGIPARVVQRMLGEQDTTFAAVLNEVRRELAVAHLADPRQSMGAIAELVGYASPSSFTRWFCAEFGVAPAAWRAGMRPGALPPHAASAA
jgi:AraC-like DNA-binding protein